MLSAIPCAHLKSGAGMASRTSLGADAGRFPTYEFSLAGKRSEKCLCIGSCLLEKALHMSEILGGGPLNKNIRFEVRKWQSSVAEKIR